MLKSGNGASLMYWFLNPHDMTKSYSKFNVFCTKHFEATSTFVSRLFPDSEYCCSSLSHAVTSQGGHPKLAYKSSYGIYTIFNMIDPNTPQYVLILYKQIIFCSFYLDLRLLPVTSQPPNLGLSLGKEE